MAPIFTGIARGFGGFGLGNVSGTTETATGGTKVTTATDTYHVFLTSGSLEVTNTISNAKVLIVAGGGGGGGYAYGGGGGGGGVVYGSNIPILTGSIPITVGSGGSGVEPGPLGGYPDPASNNGGNSSFDGVTALGGGAGGTFTNVPDGSPPLQHTRALGKAGGSSGGSSLYDNTEIIASPQPVPVSYTAYGNPAIGHPANYGEGGGGAGGSNTPNPASTSHGTLGGAGQPFTEFPAVDIAPAIPETDFGGTPLRTIWTSEVGPTGLFGGGGGGANYYTTAGDPAGGPGGGGDGGGTRDGGPMVGWAGVTYTGGGGGGTNYNSNNDTPTNPFNPLNGSNPTNLSPTYPGGAGATGLVIIKYPN